MKIVFDKRFPKLESGGSCGGRVFSSESGERLGVVYREVEWSMRGWRADGGYLATVTGYRVEFWGEGDPDEKMFATLAEATAYARAYFKDKAA